VIRLPRISNFTDFNALERLPGISLTYAAKPEDINGADLVIIPGTKNTMGDLKWLRQSGLEAQILKLASANVPVMGICGGFQMLGGSLEDPDMVEEGGTLRGMGLLPVKTVFAKEKVRTRVSGEFPGFSGSENISFTGYEIHMGETDRTGGTWFSRLTETAGGSKAGRKDGSLKEDGCMYGNVYGTYVHGLFDSEEMQRAVFRFLAEKKGVGEDFYDAGEEISAAAYKEAQYDKMADIMRENLDMDLIYRILNREDGF
jgi:adenosylcobyric acid synthase